jgi:hypothetical protein
MGPGGAHHPGRGLGPCLLRRPPLLWYVFGKPEVAEDVGERYGERFGGLFHVLACLPLSSGLALAFCPLTPSHPLSPPLTSPLFLSSVFTPSLPLAPPPLSSPFLLFPPLSSSFLPRYLRFGVCAASGSAAAPAGIARAHGPRRRRKRRGGVEGVEGVGGGVRRGKTYGARSRGGAEVGT